MPQGEPAAVTEKLVTEHARTLLRNHGLHAITVDYVARSISCEPREVWRVTPDFQVLAAELFREMVAAELAEVQARVEAIGEPEAQLAALVDILADPVHDEVTAAWVEAFSFSRRNAQLAQAVVIEEDQWLHFIENIVARGIASRTWRALDTRLFAAQLLAMIDGLNAYALAGYGTGVDRRAMLERLVQRELVR